MSPEAEVVSREEIARRVIKKLENFAEPDAEITEETRLEEDLGMTRTLRSAMALPYSKISRTFGGKPIRIAEAGDLSDVKETIDLVHRRANRS